jgi:hypothetical protein
MLIWQIPSSINSNQLDPAGFLLEVLHSFVYQLVHEFKIGESIYLKRIEARGR